MKVRELIEKLQALDPEMTILGNFEGGYEHIRVLEESVFISRELDAKVVVISEDYDAPYLSAAHVDEKYLVDKNPPPLGPRRQGLFSEIMEQQLSVIMSDMIKRDTIYLISKDNPPPNSRFVEFKIHNDRKDQNEDS